MKVLPINPIENASPSALRAFLLRCQSVAVAKKHAQLVSITITVDALDPLAVLEAIYEPGHPHFYAEHPADGTAIAGAEVALELKFDGKDRFARLQEFADTTFAHSIAVGEVRAPFGGPHVFVAATFEETMSPEEPFPALTAFVPRWQVARAGAVTTAVANFVIDQQSNLTDLAERILRAHARFTGFGYGSGDPAPTREIPSRFSQNEDNDFRASVATAVEAIDRGDFAKIVLARAIDLTADAPLHPLEALAGLREKFPDCFSFSIANGSGDSFIGASPERLVRVSQGVLEADVLAGTISRGRGAAADAAMAAELQSSTKDRHEHQLVLDSVLSHLRELGLNPEFPENPGMRKLANLQHLHTPVRATLPAEVNLLDALTALHPTPAVGGSPRESAVASIGELEGFSRGLYAGAIGWINARSGGEFMVGIRSALVRENRARVYAGAGIVAGSTPEKEFDETDLKFRALLEGLLP
ncbi:MAG: isochorismate synthase [Opitutaceae bacterium]|tara:strand:+ start:4795 stop:6213 length:1419 start_codon:yes stop_codon:yes gene_type:complete